MVFKRLSGLFGERPGATPARRGPFGLGLGRAVSFDLLRLKLELDKLAMQPPAETLVISGHGIAQLDASALIHRYYNDDNTILQVLCSDGIGDENIREITLFHPWDEVVPSSPAEWAAWDGTNGRIGAPAFEADGFHFERVWGEPATAWVPPAEFTEEVAAGDGEPRLIHQKIMPYRRQVGTLVENLLITVERDLASRDRGSISFMIGYGLARADVTPV
ncbi:DUF2491 family protein [Chelatococcus reniformis]|uniref:DUF2491 family protein n=1 Tax=Chelatococcus reniformis TaxID=1494448 RepID=A0A916XI12_9HYPH|nr:DUF2491 family protein [Chelatococcus reniformis]GGC74948.1 hypothetical protein GCM10010994_36730 [Chelatococcus reniformis]